MQRIVMHTVRLLAVAMRSACGRASAAIVLVVAMVAACWRASAAIVLVMLAACGRGSAAIVLVVAMLAACWRASAAIVLVMLAACGRGSAAIVLVVVMLAACWRGSAAMEAAQPSFIARRNALIELRHSANALSPKVELVAQRIIGLSSELERAAIRDDLVELAREVAELSRYSLDARSRGESPMLLDAVDRDLERTALVLVNLRDELRYAKTTAELAARDELERDTSADEQPAIRFRRLIEVLPPVQLPAPRRPAPPAELP